MTDAIGQQPGYASPRSTGDDFCVDLKEKIRYFERMRQKGVASRTASHSDSVLDSDQEESLGEKSRVESGEFQEAPICGNSSGIQEEKMTEDNSNVEDIVDDVIVSGEFETLNSYDLEEFDRRLTTRILENDEDAEEKSERGSAGSDNGSSSASHKVLSESVKKEEKVRPSSTASGKSSVHMWLKDKYGFFKEIETKEPRRSVMDGLPDKPAMFQCTRRLSPPPEFIKNYNFVDPRTASPFFSRKHLAQQKVFFRAPGVVLQTRPSIQRTNSIVTEEGLKCYMKVSGGAHSWYILKRNEIQSERLCDAEFASFILTDIVTEIFSRTPFVIFRGEIVSAKILGSVLCVCRHLDCIRVLQCKDASRRADHEILFRDGTIIELSCENEREEWMRILSKVSSVQD